MLGVYDPHWHRMEHYPIENVSIAPPLQQYDVAPAKAYHTTEVCYTAFVVTLSLGLSSTM